MMSDYSYADMAELENRRLADFAIMVALVPYGYEAHFVINGETIEVQCRDFGGSYSTEEIAKHLHETLRELLPTIAEPERTFE